MDLPHEVVDCGLKCQGLNAKGHMKKYIRKLHKCEVALQGNPIFIVWIVLHCKYLVCCDL
jgi:hypothetical protein